MSTIEEEAEVQSLVTPELYLKAAEDLRKAVWAMPNSLWRVEFNKEYTDYMIVELE